MQRIFVWDGYCTIKTNALVWYVWESSDICFCEIVYPVIDMIHEWHVILLAVIESLLTYQPVNAVVIPYDRFYRSA